MTRQAAKAVLGTVVAALLWIGAPFAGAGGFHWYRAWICVVLYVVCMSAAGLILRRLNPAVLKARVQWRRPDTKPFDKIFLAVYFPLIYLQLVVSGLDVARYRWTSMPFWLVYPGALLFILSIGIIGWPLAVNRFAENTVRIQSERGHTVVTAGPYRIVRHPLYVGSILMYIATALILGSVWALAIAGAIMILFIWRTALEDRMLRAELAGYAEYATETQYRLIPRVW
jgi:protein-S-isoprenylcysteine O-methyltransferase Ste14